MPSRPTPIATHAHTFIPVKGSVPPWPPAEVPLPLAADEFDVLLAAAGGVCESVLWLVEDDEPSELDDEPVEPVEPVEPEPDEPLGWEVVVDPVSGSTYCWSPAEVLVPDASTAAAPASEPTNRPTRHANVRMTRRTQDIEPGISEEGVGGGSGGLSAADASVVPIP
jgi:hypothetical protein